MMEFPNFDGFIFPSYIYNRGKHMYEEECVKNISTIAPGHFTTTVDSESLSHLEYDISIQIQNNSVVQCVCTCPYNKSNTCKHIVAVLFEIRALDLYNIEDEYIQYNTGEQTNFLPNNSSANGNDFPHPIDQHNINNSSNLLAFDNTQMQLQNQSNFLSLGPDNSRSNSLRSSQKKDKQHDLSDTEQQVYDQLMQEEVGLHKVLKEMECQICLYQLKDPYLMPCHAHSVCYECLRKLLSSKEIDKYGGKTVCCPTCGIKSGVSRVFQLQSDMKRNKELLRIQEAYLRERKTWIKTVMEMQRQMNDIKAVYDKQIKEQQEQFDKATSTGGLTSENKNTIISLCSVEKEKQHSERSYNLRSSKNTKEGDDIKDDGDANSVVSLDIEQFSSQGKSKYSTKSKLIKSMLTEINEEEKENENENANEDEEDDVGIISPPKYQIQKTKSIGKDGRESEIFFENSELEVPNSASYKSSCMRFSEFTSEKCTPVNYKVILNEPKRPLSSYGDDESLLNSLINSPTVEDTITKKTLKKGKNKRKINEIATPQKIMDKFGTLNQMLNGSENEDDRDQSLIMTQQRQYKKDLEEHSIERHPRQLKKVKKTKLGNY